MKKLVILLMLMAILAACSPATPTAAPTENTVPNVESQTAEPNTEATQETVATEAPVVEPTSEPVGPKNLTYGLGQEGWPTRGFAVDTDDAFVFNSNFICETLVGVDLEGNMIPLLSTEWKMVDDTTWEFNLRTDVTFQNGDKFNAEAVVKSLMYIANSPTPPRGFSSKTFASIEAVGEDVVRITTAATDVLMPNRLTAPATCVWAPSAYIAESGPIDPFGTGTGAFMMTASEPEVSITLVRNPNWWGGKAVLDEITMLYIPDAKVRSGMLQSGEIKFSSNIPIEQVSILEADPNLTVVRLPETRTTTLHLNMSRAPFSDVRVRQAVSYALDRQLIVDTVLEGIAAPALGPISPAEGWFNTDLKGYGYDPEKAKALLAEAGIEPGKLTVSLWTYASRAILPPIAVVIQGMLADVGINVEIRVAQYEALEADVLSGNYDMFLTSRNHVLDTYDPEGFFTSDYSCGGSFNMDQYCDEAFDALLVEARNTPDPTARFDIYRQLQQMIEDDAVGVYIHYNVRVNAYTKDLVNVWEHPLGRFYINPTTDIAP